MENIIGRTLDEAFVTTVGLHCDQVSQMFALYQDIKHLEATDAVNWCLKHKLIDETEGGQIYNNANKNERMILLVQVIARNMEKTIEILKMEGRNVSSNRLKVFLDWPKNKFDLGLKELIALLRTS